LFEFLSSFPYQEYIADNVKSGKATTDQLFPPGKVFQAKYAACALQQKLKEQLRRVVTYPSLLGSSADRDKGTLDEQFLLNAIQLMTKAILNQNLMSDTFSEPHELHLASMLVCVLLEFLKGETRIES
jgi:ubiquitin carboxyl-terminal hydrolase 34